MTEVESSELRPGTIFAMAATAALTAGNLYYNQPLLVDLQEAFHATARQVGSIPTLTQVGYALGMLLLIPMGDMFERRRLIVLSLMGVAVALLLAAGATSLWMLALASLLIGMGTMAPQLIVPMAAHLAPPARRGRVLGIVTSGLVTGILLARTFSGLVGTRFGWRVMFAVAAAIMLLLIWVVRRYIPRSHPGFTGNYVALMRSVWQLLREEPVLRECAGLGAMLFASFSAFWATLAFMLAEAPYHYGPAETGMFGLVGAAGAGAASMAGRLADRVDPRRLMQINFAAIILAYVVMWVFQTWLIGVIVGVVLLDAGVQGGHVTNQTRIFALREDARSRLNTAYMFLYFTGGAAGSFLAVWAWSIAGWQGVCGLNVLGMSAGLLWFRRRLGR